MLAVLSNSCSYWLSCWRIHSGFLFLFADFFLELFLPYPNISFTTYFEQLLEVKIISILSFESLVLCAIHPVSCCIGVHDRIVELQSQIEPKILHLNEVNMVKVHAFANFLPCCPESSRLHLAD